MPQYGEILKVVGQQLALRKGDIFKRTLLVIWPFALLAGYLQMVREGFQSSIAQYVNSNPVVSLSVMVGLIAVLMVYYIIVGTIVSIEKYLWIDSAFDGNAMDSKKSWHIAWKLLLPLCALTIQILVRYYVLPVCVLFGSFAVAFITAPYVHMVQSDYLILMALVYGCLAIVFVVYTYFLRIKLRFAYFLFIDRYNTTTFTYSALFDEMERLNAVCKSESFRKTLIINLGSDALGTITQAVISIFTGSVASLGRVGGVLGAFVRPVTEESARQFNSFARLVAIYLLYINARAALNAGTGQEVNPYVYGL